MNIGIYTQEERYLPLNELTELMQLSKQHSVNTIFNKEYAEEMADKYGLSLNSYSSAAELPEDTSFMLSYGGDGTFLKCVKIIYEKQIPIIGINRGSMGFLLSTHVKNSNEAFSALLNGNYTIETRNMLAVTGLFDNKTSTINAFNEFTIQKSELNMINVEMKINNTIVTTYRADGIIVSTPSGSTAYSMSVGGPIVSPSCNCFIITPIAPHNLTMRPLIVDGSDKITLCSSSRSNFSRATIDNTSFTIPNNTEFNLALSVNKVKIIKINGDSYFDTLTKKLMWGKQTE